jgi:hypothetical protein
MLNDDWANLANNAVEFDLRRQDSENQGVQFAFALVFGGLAALCYFLYQAGSVGLMIIGGIILFLLLCFKLKLSPAVIAFLLLFGPPAGLVLACHYDIIPDNITYNKPQDEKPETILTKEEFENLTYEDYVRSLDENK